MKISVLGCGRWGSCIAWYLDKIGHDVLSCGLPDAPEFIQLKTHHCNDYLVFPETIEVSADLGYAVNRAEVIVISISSQYLRSYFQEIAQYALEGKTIVLCMKGVEATTGKRLSEIVGEFVDESKTPVAVWVGPGHPQDYVKGIPNCMVIDSNNREVKERLVKAFTGAAAKNVIGIAAGILDGLGYTSLKGGLMARGAQEIARLIEALGGNKMSAFGLCHLGDYEATLFSPWSHNRRYGEAFAKGQKFDKLAEGVMTSKALYKLGVEHNVDLPIVGAVYRALFEHASINDEIQQLFLRSVKDEF